MVAMAADALADVLYLIVYIRKLRQELAPLAEVPSARSVRVTPRQRSAIFDLLRTVDELFPGPPPQP